MSESKDPFDRETDNGPLNEKSDNIKVPGYTGTWYVIDVSGGSGYEPKLFLLESEQDGDECAHLVVDERAVAIWDGCYNDWDDLNEAVDDGTIVYVKRGDALSGSEQSELELISETGEWKIYRKVGWKGAFG